MQLKSKEVQCNQENAGQIIYLLEWLWQTARHLLSTLTFPHQV